MIGMVFKKYFCSDSQKFLHLIRTTTSSKIEITKQQKDKINLQIDKKMQQLENTGLSKQEIILSKSQKGLPLKLDPFFQFIKNNKTAREIYLRSTDRFTVAKVIDIALRQDIGPDPSYSRVRDKTKMDTKGRAEYLSQITERKFNKFDPSSYYGNQQFNLKKAEQQIRPFQPIKYIYKPIDRWDRKKSSLRRLKKYDIHWRNVELLRQFMTKNGNIKDRTINLLETSDQKKVSKCIKTARQMGSLPYYGRLAQPLKRNITSLEDEVQQIGYQHINIQTGHVYERRSRSMDSVEVQTEKESDLDHKYSKMIQEGQHYRLWTEEIPKTKDKTLLKAQQYAKYLKQKSNQNKPKQKKQIEIVLKKLTNLDPNEPQKILPSNSQECYSAYREHRNKFIKQFEENPLSFSDLLLKQKLQV